MNAFNHEGYAPIHLAVLSESLDILRELLSNGRDLKVNINVPDKRAGFTALHYAAMNFKRTPLCNILVKHDGIDLNVRSYNGCTPLHVAIANRNYLITMCLIRYGADLNAQSDIPIHTDFDSFQLTQKKYTLLQKCVESIFDEYIKTTKIKNDAQNASDMSSSPSVMPSSDLNKYIKLSQEVKRRFDAELEKDKYEEESLKNKIQLNLHTYDAIYYAQNDQWVFKLFL